YRHSAVDWKVGQFVLVECGPMSRDRPIAPTDIQNIGLIDNGPSIAAYQAAMHAKSAERRLFVRIGTAKREVDWSSRTPDLMALYGAIEVPPYNIFVREASARNTNASTVHEPAILGFI